MRALVSGECFEDSLLCGIAQSQPTVCCSKLSCFQDVIRILKDLIDRSLITPADILEGKGGAGGNETVQSVVMNWDDQCKEADVIVAACTELVKAPYNGVVPSTFDGLKALKVCDNVILHMMQHVFGCTELYFGLAFRKLVVAIDLIDWEEGGVAEKEKVKMAKIPLPNVKKSVLTWLPNGNRLVVQDTLEVLAITIGRNRSGFWGQLQKVANQKFSKDKKLLIEMAEDIHRFFKAVKKRKTKA